MENTKLILKIYSKDFPVGKLSDADCRRIKEEMGTYIPFDEIYHLGNGRITGKQGWEENNK